MNQLTELKREILAQELLIKETTADLQQNLRKIAELEQKETPRSKDEIYAALDRLLAPVKKPHRNK